MDAIQRILDTIGSSLTIIVIMKIASLIRTLLVKAAIKSHQNYNIKHGFPINSRIDLFDENSVSYHADSIKGYVMAIVIFLLELAIILIVPGTRDNLFSIAAAFLSIIVFLGCWIMRNLGTNKYRVLVYISSGVSLFFLVHIIVSLVLDRIVIVAYDNSINAILYFWVTTLFYKLIMDRK